MSGRDSRRRQLESRIREDLKDVLPEDMFEAQRIVDEKVHERVRATGADNFSRVVGELEKCGYIARYYEGYRTPHSNRGGPRHLVCVLDPDVSAPLRSRNQLELVRASCRERDGQYVDISGVDVQVKKKKKL